MIFDLVKHAKQCLFDSKKLKATNVCEAIDEVAEGMVYGEVKSGECVSNSAAASIPEVTVYGKSTQTGEPTPDVPVDIVSVYKELTIKSCGKNLFNVNELEVGALDKSTGLEIADEPTRRTPYIRVKSNTQYIMSSSVVVRIFFYDTKKNHISNIVSNGGVFSTPSNCNYIRLHANYNDNPIFTREFMLCEGIDDTYEPYVSSQADLSLADDLRGIPVTEGGNYTDANGQNWICDTLEKYADGTGKLIQRVVLQQIKTVNRCDVLGETIRTAVALYKNSIKGAGLCSHINKYRQNYSADEVHFYTEYVASSQYGQVWFFLPIDVCGSTVDEINTWLSNNEFNVLYALAEPIETDLTAEQVTELEKLQSFKPYTTLVTDNVKCAYLVNSASGRVINNHNHNDIYYIKSEVDTKLNNKSEITTQTFSSFTSDTESNTLSIDVSKTGYTPLGVLQLNITGKVDGLECFCIENNILYIKYSSVTSAHGSVTVLYIRS